MYRCSAASSLALAAALVTAPVYAQEVRGPESPTPTVDASVPAQTATVSSAAPGQSQGLGDIVVTARKVAENLQNVPVAVTAFSGAALQQQNAVQVSDIARLTPGLIITPSTSTGAGSQFTIRGQVQQDNLATLDPSVGLYVDGYYWARAYGINANLLDIQDVQTLKGPQGTLFGRNTTGGAILIETNNPSFRDGISVLASGTYGRFNQWSGTGIVNVPLVDDKLAVRVAYGRNTRDGYADDVASGSKLDSQNEYTVRGKLLYKPTSNLSILLSAEQYRTKFLGNPYREQYVGPDSPINQEAAVEGLGFAGAGALGCLSATPTQACLQAGNALLATSEANANKGDSVDLNVLPRTYAKTNTYTATTTLDTFFGAIKAIGGYRKVRSSADVDLDGSPYNGLATRGEQDLSQYSVEVQATGKAFDNRLDFAAGVFYFHESGYDLSYSSALSLLNPTSQFIRGDIDNDSQGLYGQGTYHVTDKLSFTGGLRYSIDDKRLISNNGVYSAGDFAGPAPGATFSCSLAQCPESRHASYSGLSYTAGIDYKVTSDILVYAKTAKGFRSGGQNMRGTEFFPSSENPFKPEKATSYEAGVKTELLDRKLRINAAGYYTIDKGIQRTTLLADALGNTATEVTNAGRADIYGGEIEASALLPAGFRIDGTLAYTHPEYKSYVSFDPSGVNLIDRSKERFYGIAKWTSSISPSWTHDFAFGQFLLRGDFSYQSKMALYGNGYYVNSAGATIDASTGAAVSPAVAAGMLKATTDEAHWLIGARAGVTVLDGKLDLAVWGKNLTNKRDLVVALPISGLEEASAMRREPRTVGVTATIKFKHL
jgi:iron complex outermembrane receptor protein